MLDKLSARAARERLDKRRLQAEIDTHRLYLLTSFQARCSAGELWHMRLYVSASIRMPRQALHAWQCRAPHDLTLN